MKALLCTALALSLIGAADAQGLALGHTKDVDPVKMGRSQAVTVQTAIPVSATPIIRVYKNFESWGPGDSTALAALGKVQGTDWFVHPVSDCASGIPVGTSVVYFTPNAIGDSTTSAQERDPACQAALQSFLASGGKLIVDMADNEPANGFVAPGSSGTPDYYFFPVVTPAGVNDVSPTLAALGPDGVPGTPDDHPFLKGPDGVAGSGDDVTDANSDGCCYQAHGSLDKGMTMPAGARSLLFARFDDGGVISERPILAEYCMGPGRVIVDTMTNGFAGGWYGWQPGNPSYAQTSLLSYALSSASNCAWPFKGFLSPVDNPPVINGLKAGSAVPVKFSLGGDRGLDIIAAGYPASAPLACDSGALSDAVTETSSAGSSSLSYDPSTDQYVYTWKTDKGWASSCRQLTLKLKDGTSHTAIFRFTK
jgi:hypothetical protein